MNTETKDLVEKYANLLDNAMATRQAMGPIAAAEPTLTIHDAYAIQLKNIALALSRGAKISGKKIGLTSLAMQNLLGVNEPDYGHLLDNMDLSGKPVPVNLLLQPRVEGEIAFVLKEDVVGPNATVEDVFRATDYVVAALEIVDSRILDWKIKLIDTVSDNASSGLYVLGEKKVRLSEINLPQETMTLYKNGQKVNDGSGAAVMGDPALCVAWLANKLSQFDVVLRKGEVVLSGALSAMAPVQAGDTFEAEFGILGKVRANFV